MSGTTLNQSSLIHFLRTMHHRGPQICTDPLGMIWNILSLGARETQQQMRNTTSGCTCGLAVYILGTSSRNDSFSSIIEREKSFITIIQLPGAVLDIIICQRLIKEFKVFHHDFWIEGFSTRAFKRITLAEGKNRVTISKQLPPVVRRAIFRVEPVVIARAFCNCPRKCFNHCSCKGKTTLSHVEKIILSGTLLQQV